MAYNLNVILVVLSSIPCSAIHLLLLLLVKFLLQLLQLLLVISASNHSICSRRRG